MILSDGDIKKRVLSSTVEGDNPHEWWENGDWSKIGDSIFIDPFNQSSLHACTYELHVGPEYRLLQEPHTPRYLNYGENFELGPSETALLLTEEYLALPKNIMGLVVPRARRLFEGSTIAATRVDPTWYGKLLIGFTNLSKNPTAIYRQDSVCALYLAETGIVDNVLTKSTTPFLGRAEIGKIELPNIRERQLRRGVDDVTRQDIEDVVETFGRPYDVVFGALELTRRTTFEAVERELGPKLAEAATTQAIRSAFRFQQWLLATLVVGVLSVAIGGLVTAIIKIF